MQPERHTTADIVVTGLGPTGSTLCNLLGGLGLSVLALDQEADFYPLPRAVHFDDEIMRVFQNIGLSNEINDKVRYNPGMRFVDAEGNTLVDWPRPAGLTGNGWRSSYRFHQPDLERCLSDGLKRFPNVQIKRQHRLLTASENNDAVKIEHQCLATEQNYSTTCQYLIGCDGANSSVRQLMGASVDDLGFHERWLVIDVQLKRDRPDLGDVTIQHCNADRPATYVRCPGNRRRWELTLRDDEATHDACDPENIWICLQPWITQQDAEIERAAVYTFRSQLTSHWRRGRMLLAGDAAHLMPPFMGQGMCTGIRDVANLAWKLAILISNVKGDQQINENLLKSYQQERYSHAKQYIDLSVQLGQLINTHGTDNTLATLQLDKASTMKSPAPQLGRGMQAGDTTHSGKLFPQCVLNDGQWLDTTSPYRPMVIMDPDFAREIGLDVSQNLDKLPIDARIYSIADHTELNAIFRQFDCKLIVVRPDRYILGAANNRQQWQQLIATGIF